MSPLFPVLNHQVILPKSINFLEYPFVYFSILYIFI